jgi:hypothetical protein
MYDERTYEYIKEGGNMYFRYIPPLQTEKRPRFLSNIILYVILTVFSGIQNEISDQLTL